VVVTTVPLILAMYLGKYCSASTTRFLWVRAPGARTTTASLGMVNDRAKSQIPGLGYTVTYAVGNTLLTIWGMVLVMMLS
jgi:putative transport protein